MHASSELLNSAKPKNIKHLSYGLIAPGLLQRRYTKSLVEDKANSESDYIQSNVALGFANKEEESLVMR